MELVTAFGYDNLSLNRLYCRRITRFLSTNHDIILFSSSFNEKQDVPLMFFLVSYRQPGRYVCESR